MRDSVRLQEVTVRSQTTTRVLAGGNIRLDPRSLANMGRVMGETDMVNAFKRMGGISSSGDYGSGIIIQGNDPGQSLFLIDQAPVFFPYRFAGIFSTFNSPHFSSVELIQAGRTASGPSRLGAIVELKPKFDYRRTIGGVANVGLLASSATLTASASRRFALTASGRVSYVDQLYSKFLNTETGAIGYQFVDLNVSAGFKIDSINSLTANYFHNGDGIHTGNSHYSMTTRLRWHNNVGSVSWNGRNVRATVYVSEFASTLTVELPQFSIVGNSSISLYGGKGEIKLNEVFNAGAEVEGYNIIPLWAELQGLVSTDSPEKSVQRPWQGRAFADAAFRPKENVFLKVGLSASVFAGRFFSADPRMSLEYRKCKSVWSFGAGLFSQYLHQVGFSDIGLASNFWYGSIGRVKPQHSLDFTAAWQRPFFSDELLISALAYAKRIWNQTEYQGNVLDIVMSDYSPESSLFSANGYNAGFNVTARKRYGQLTASLSYAYGYAIRKHDGQWFRSATDMGHQLKADAEYLCGKHWIFGASFTFASGRVYTPTRYLYLISGKVLTEYGRRNSGRLPSYQRLDISATYRIKGHSINLSLINAYGHRNVELQYFGVDRDSGDLRLVRESSLYRFLPSLSYSFEF